MSEKAPTPMMEQYLRIKKSHPETLLFFRLGDFYEMFYEDAKKASAVLEIALTSRHKVPMCGVPHHAADRYLTKLLKHGYKVAVCEQVEDPKKAKGVVKREVTKILTPGTAIEFDLRGEKESSYIASVFIEKEDWGLSMIDLASGDIRTMQSDASDKKVLSDEIFRLSPKEVIFPASQEESIYGKGRIDDRMTVHKSKQEDWIFDLAQTRNELNNHFKVKSLAGFDLEDKDLAVRASGALLYYLKGLRNNSLSLIRRISFLHSRYYITLDTSSIKNLELVRNLRDGRRQGSFLDTIDLTVTSMGGRLIRYWLLHPVMDTGEIHIRLDAVSEFLEKTIERHDLRDSLKEIFDLERLTGKVSLSVAHAKDLVSLKKSLMPLPGIKRELKAFSSKKLKALHKSWDNAEDIVDLIERAIREEPSFLLTDGGIIAENYNKELDELRQISRSGKSFIVQLERREKERTGITSLKVRYNKVFGYYIEVTRSNLSLVPEDYIRKQTLVNSERFITPELKDYEEKVLNAEQRIGELEYKLFLEVRERISANTERLQTISANIAVMDVLSAMAELAAQRNFNRPIVDEKDRIKIVSGRHPVIEYWNDEPFIPNDTYLNQNEDQILIVTGPNMGGKSTYLRQVALICILAQMGSFVPAKEAEIGVVDRIFTRIGAMDFLSVGQSTFMVEMLETANILNNATEKSLILLDEIGRGTSTFDGLSLAWAISEFLHENESIRAKTLFATHYHELTELSLTLNRIKNYHVSVKEQKEDIIFLRKIIPGPSDQSYGIHVAKLAGIPDEVIDRAKEILFNLEKKELDDSGAPRIAYRTADKRNRSQLFLFEEDKELALLDTIREELLNMDISQLTPIEALNRLSKLKDKLVR